ncbi:MAG: small ribosomal subunit Rsm22 family protein [Phenylobacterium sp.]|nr:small ribosomal subunit Rsm22 family protein [Phenylobacterium sp.]
MDAALPEALRAAIDRRLEGQGRAGLAQRAQALSEGYRGGRASSALVRGEADALAYALTRTPATYAAARRALEEVLALRPDLAVSSLLDAGAGPGGGGWAAIDALPGLSAVIRLDHSPAFLDLAEDLAAAGPAPLASAARLRADLADPALSPPQADLVLAAYALTEIPAAALPGVVERLWSATRGLFLVVEPGSPEAWRRGLEIRTRLIAAGARLVGPCPHEAACPLAAPDWCHFAQRLPRGREHRLAKGGAAPFEDEKFFWLAFERAGPVSAGRAPARIIAPPRPGKPGVRLRLCQPDGRIENADIPRRDKAAFARARRLGWGETFDPAASQ